MEQQSPFRSVVSRRTLFGGMAGGAITIIAGCKFDDDKSPGTSGGADPGVGTTTIRLAIGTVIDSLDPHFVDNGSYITPCGLLEGLVSHDETGKGVVPAIAEKWNVSADGLTYTFHLRASAKFSNGDPIAAKDFEWTFKRLLTPTAAGGGGGKGASAYKPSLGIKGATDYMAGTLDDWSMVGVHATDGSTLVITLATPNSAFLLGMAEVPMLLLHQASVEKDATGWMQPANWVGSGPYVLTEWTPTASLSMKKHDFYWDRDNIKVDQMNVRVISSPPATVLAYRNNEIDMMHTDYNSIANDAKMRQQTIAAEGFLTYYLQAMFSQHPAGRDARVRQALSMAIDRSKVSKVEAGTRPGPALVPDAVPGWDNSIAVAFDVDKAKNLMSAAGYPEGKGMPTIQIMEYASSPWADAVSDMWGSHLGVTVKTRIVDVGQFFTVRYVPIEDANMIGFYAGSFGGLPTMNNWVIDLWGPDVVPMWSLAAESAKRYQAIQASKELAPPEKLKKLAALIAADASPEAKEFAAAALEAKAETDPAKQTAAYLGAARQRAALSFEIPVLWGNWPLTVKPTVKGVHPLYTPSSFYLKGVSVSK